jgi:hypothetical protein
MNKQGQFGPIKFDLWEAPYADTGQEKARYAQHEVIAGKAVLEFVGGDLDKRHFEFTYDVDAGTDPDAMLTQWRALLTSGKSYPLRQGEKDLGHYALESLSWERLAADPTGATLSLKVTVDLIEHPDPPEANTPGRGRAIAVGGNPTARPARPPPPTYVTERRKNADGYEYDAMVRK